MFTSCYLPDPYLANKVVRDFSHFWRGCLRFGFYIYLYIVCSLLAASGIHIRIRDIVVRIHVTSRRIRVVRITTPLRK